MLGFACELQRKCNYHDSQVTSKDLSQAYHNPSHVSTKDGIWIVYAITSAKKQAQEDIRKTNLWAKP